MTRRQRNRVSRQERKIKRWALGGGEPPPRIELPRRPDPLHLFNAEGQRCEDGIRNLWHGQSAFLVGGGPSLKHINLSRMAERGVLSLGINNVAGYIPCNAFVCGDPAMKFHECIWNDGRIIKFVPRKQLHARTRVKRDGRFLWSDKAVGDCPNVFGLNRGSKFDPATFFATDYASWGAKGDEGCDWPNIRFTMFIGFRLLHFLGVRNIFLLGTDFVKDGDLKYVFEVDKPGACKGSGGGHWKKAPGMFEALKPYLPAAGLRVYDSGPVSELGVFGKIAFDDAIAMCQQGIGPTDAESFTGHYSHHVLTGDTTCDVESQDEA